MVVAVFKWPPLIIDALATSVEKLPEVGILAEESILLGCLKGSIYATFSSSDVLFFLVLYRFIGVFGKAAELIKV